MSRSETRPRKPRRRKSAVLALTAGAIAFAVIIGAILWATVLTGTGARVAENDTPVTLGDQNAPVTVAVPAGWVTQRPPFRGDTLVVRSPDAVLTLTITAVGMDGEQAFADASQDLGTVGTPVTETLGSGLSVIHGRTDDAVVAAVGVPDADRSATVIARVSGESLGDYLPAVAQILDGLGVTS